MALISVTDAAEHFGISKEAIHNRIRRGSLKSVFQDGIKMVEVDVDTKLTSNRPRPKPATPSSDDRYYKLLEEQNAQLQMRVEKLEDETKKLRDQKEQMLIQERIDIEQIYKDKDEQLKNMLSAIASKFMLQAPEPEVIEQAHVEAEIEEVANSSDKLISLKKFLKKKKLSDKKRDKIIKRFMKNAKNDERIVIIGKKYYINTSKYDYKDLMKV